MDLANGELIVLTATFTFRQSKLYLLINDMIDYHAGYGIAEGGGDVTE